MSTTLYFESLGNRAGLNPVTENPCNLLDFGLVKLEACTEYSANSTETEIMAVILGGKGTITVGSTSFENIGQRPNVFSGKPFSVYIPPASSFAIKASPGSPLEVALCSARV